MYSGQWSAVGVRSVGSEPVGSSFESTRGLALLERDADRAWLRVFDIAVPLLDHVDLTQPTASPGTTSVDFEAYSPDYYGYVAECTGCVVPLASVPDVITADAVVFGEATRGVTLSLGLTLVPPAELTGEMLVVLPSAGGAWRLVSGEWVKSGCEHYQSGVSAWYRIEHFIDDQHPETHGVRVNVLSCQENCPAPRDEGDSCPPYPDASLCH